MPANIPVRASEQLAFRGEVPVAARLAACREFLRTETASLRQRHEAGLGDFAILVDGAGMRGQPGVVDGDQLRVDDACRGGRSSTDDIGERSEQRCTE